MGEFLAAVVLVCVVIAIVRYVRRRRVMATDGYPGELTEIRAKVNRKAMAKGDPWETQVLGSLEYTVDGKPVSKSFNWINAGQLPAAVRRRTVGSLVVMGDRRFAIADPQERDQALHAAKNGGHTFRLDPPMPVTVFEDDRGGVVWKLA